MSKQRCNTFTQLARLGINGADAAALVRASATLHMWAEHECNGVIQRDEVTDKPAWYSPHTGKRIGARKVWVTLTDGETLSIPRKEFPATLPDGNALAFAAARLVADGPGALS